MEQIPLTVRIAHVKMSPIRSLIRLNSNAIVQTFPLIQSVQTALLYLILHQKLIKLAACVLQGIVPHQTKLSLTIPTQPTMALNLTTLPRPAYLSKQDT